MLQIMDVQTLKYPNFYILYIFHVLSIIVFKLFTCICYFYCYIAGYGFASRQVAVCDLRSLRASIYLHALVRLASTKKKKKIFFFF